jgi:hypothetical protein
VVAALHFDEDHRFLASVGDAVGCRPWDIDGLYRTKFDAVASSVTIAVPEITNQCSARRVCRW